MKISILNMLILILILVLPISTFSQNVIKGHILDEESKMPIRYSTISYPKINYGISADSNGFFKFEGKIINTDSLIISSVGYSNFILKQKNFADSTFYLTKKVNSLPNILVANKNKSIKLNSFNSPTLASYTTFGVVTELARYFSNKYDNKYLKQVIIAKRPGLSMFFVKIYSKDSATNLPLEEIYNKQILVSSNKKMVKLDLSELAILLPKNGFFIAIEWIKVKENETRNTQKFNGQKVSVIDYEPFLSLSYKLPNVIVESGAYILDYRGRWSYILPNVNFLISAEISD